MDTLKKRFIELKNENPKRKKYNIVNQISEEISLSRKALIYRFQKYAPELIFSEKKITKNSVNHRESDYEKHLKLFSQHEYLHGILQKGKNNNE